MLCRRIGWERHWGVGEACGMRGGGRAGGIGGEMRYAIYPWGC